jgi:hypothetical protein
LFNKEIRIFCKLCHLSGGPGTQSWPNFHNALISLASFLAFNSVTLIDHNKNALMKATNWKIFGSIAVTMLMIVGCSAPVHVEKDDSVDFSKYRTFAWVDKDGPGKKTGIEAMTSWNKSLKTRYKCARQTRMANGQSQA